MNDRRREIPMDDKHLGQLAENTARALRVRGTISTREERRAVRKSLEILHRVQTQASCWATGHQPLPQEIEWLLDNYYLARREGQEALEALDKRLHIPAVEQEKRVSRISELARTLAWAGTVTPERLELFLERSQGAQPLSELELSLFIPVLKGALLERLAAACREMEGIFCAAPPFQGEEAAKAAAAEGKNVSAALENELCRAQAEHERLTGIAQNIFTALRSLAAANLGKLLEKTSRVERILEQDPTGDYPRMDDATRNGYRREVCRLAKRKGMEETAVAARALELAKKGGGEERHVGWFLFIKPLGEKKREPTGALYVAAIVLPTLFLALLAGFLLHSIAAALLLLLPVSDIVKNSVDFLAVRLFRPRSVHRMALKEGLPREGKTLCVIASLLTGDESGKVLAARLERYRLANRDAGENLLFGILADLPDSEAPMGEEGRKLAAQAAEAIHALNRKYGEGFYLFFRQPTFQTQDERYMGWERKRGALLELCRCLRGSQSGMEVRAGERRALGDVRYVITLDGDTSLNVGAARKLVGAMLHPLNRPKVDRRRRIVTAGYGLLQPRIGVDLHSANRSQFARIFAGQGGVEPYSAAASDVYHDLFDQGTYTGKGIFNVDVFLQCLEGRFPTNRILSHDLLEGSYLHAGLIGDVELTDSHPYKVTAYFSRLHRWVRGDWQLLPWLRRRVRDQDGNRQENPISPMAKWKIFDNLRRSLSPVFTLTGLLLGMCFSGEVFAAAALAAILSAASNLLLSGAELAFRQGQGLRTRYHSTIIVGLGGAVLQTIVQLLFLPIHAWTCASAIVTALWRSFVTHKGMLAWTTAAAAEKRAGSSLWANFRCQWSAVAVGIVAMAGSSLPAGAAVGLVWALSPAFSWAMSRPIDGKRSLPPADRAFLLHEGVLIWRYFADFLRPQDHWLPPDNYQEQPAVGLARRTSPTNIGLALLSILAAADLDFISRKHGAELVGHMLDTLEELPKWKGHLYNWYDTASAQPLHPRYISTVDSGNLCGSLIALREGLYEWGEAELGRRAEKLAADMDFSALYDGERRLFFIGYEAEKEEYTKGWYDLMASEARQTCYLAVARGEVERRSWEQLGRMLVKENDFMGMASWTGTMFEYFMPNLLLPCEENSLMYESLAFCVYAQRLRTAKRNVPWGISESCFFAFDPGMSYQYKAHGVQKLGLKRGLDEELVVAPYASFLALLLAPGRAVRNLRRLRDMGSEGKYGLYEALDFTRARLSGGEEWEIVRCYMAHHLGMSLVAIDNALKENIMQKRFMRDCSMGAYRELLEEKVPVGAAAMRSQRREVPEKLHRVQPRAFQRCGTGTDRQHPACHLVSNGAYSVFCTDYGGGISSLERTALTLGRLGEEGKAEGISIFLRDDSGNVTRLFSEEEGAAVTWCYTGNGAEWSWKKGGMSAKQVLRVPERENGERRELELTWQGAGSFQGEVVCALEPVLARQADYDAHPAFSKLALESERTLDGVLFTRRARRKGEETTALAVAWDGEESGFSTSRESALGRGGLRGLGNALRRPLDGAVGAVLDPCLLVRFPVKLKEGGEFCLKLTLAAGERERAVQTAGKLLRMTEIEGSSRLEQLMGMGEMTQANAVQAFQLLERLKFPAEDDRQGEACQEALWPFGISGDVPIAAYRVQQGEEIEPLLDMARQHRLLVGCGFAYDLVYLLEETGDYRRPVRNALWEGLKAAGMEPKLGQRGGIHLVNCADEHAADSILAAAAVELKTEELWSNERKQQQQRKYVKKNHFTLEPGIPEWKIEADGSVVFSAGRTLPPVGWSQILAQEQFGWMTDETGCGHLWYRNARENQLLEWENDPLQVGGTEGVFLEKDGVRCSLFADGDAVATQVRYAMGWASWEKEWQGVRARLTAFVPQEAPARVFLIELSGPSDGMQLGYWLRPLMAAERNAAQFVKTECKEDILAIKNPWNRTFWPQEMLVAASERQERWERQEDGAMETGWSGIKKLVLVVGCASAEAEKQAVLELKDWEKAEAMLERTRRWWHERVQFLTVKTPSPALDVYLNGWALYQVLACRLFGRTSRYQGGGAYGFRDQLQDVCALLYGTPEAARQQILRSCAHQFEEGDVQHWWHPGMGEGESGMLGERGVRTRISDDLLWLPYALCEYLEKTGDMDILEETEAYLTAPVLDPGEAERYERPTVSREKDSVYDHAVRAIELVLARGTGKHGLARIGSGDWNDGMNRVGHLGRGESVWLSWFAAYVLRRFSALAEHRGDSEHAEKFRRAAEEYCSAAEEAWDGEWFRRGYYDDGTPLGSRENEECSLDSIAQSWAALALGENEKAKRAMRSALDRLVEEKERLVRLFTPPFQEGAQDPGYIRSYLPGIRENGGQYTHGAVWLALGCFQLGMKEEGWRVLELLLPGEREEQRYKAEPYVLAGDVYANSQHLGRGGWSWYTGAAGWYWRTAVEAMLGLQVCEKRLFIRPQLPEIWQGYEAQWKTEKGSYQITIRRGVEKGILMDGKPVSGGIGLNDLEGEHRILVTI